MEGVQEGLIRFSILANNQGRVSHGSAFFIANLKVKLVDTLPVLALIGGAGNFHIWSEYQM
jgi:hypothetical protein